METIKSILERLQVLYKVPNNRQLSNKLDINYNTLNTWIKRESIPYDLLHKIVQNENISMDWLFRGKGEAHITIVEEKTINRVGTDNSGMVGNHITNSSVTITNGSQHPKEVTSLEDDMLECYRALELDMQEYYYHKIKADSLAQKMKDRV